MFRQQQLSFTMVRNKTYQLNKLHITCRIFTYEAVALFELITTSFNRPSMQIESKGSAVLQLAVKKRVSKIITGLRLNIKSLFIIAEIYFNSARIPNHVVIKMNN